ncbi:proline-rich protein 36-like [Panicum virgatum]|uniref:proline-rich protein 36-like n=1 Tax=Panicum virgatum TaxID=38727 RepID=UPI0019D63FCE|nr:proline-rich protein 36-like [Panicum virgatum]
MFGHLASTAAAASAAIPATSVPLATYSTTPPLASTLGPPSSAPPYADSSAAASVPAAALDTLTAAIYGLQRQMGQFAARLADVERCPGPSAPPPGEPLPSTTAIYGLQRQVHLTSSWLADVGNRPSTAAGAPAAAPYPTLGLSVPPLPLLQGALSSSALHSAGPPFSQSAPSPHPQTAPAPASYGGVPQAPPTTSVVVHTSTASRSFPITQIPFPPSPSPIPSIPQLPSHHIAHHDPAEDHDGGITVPRYHKLSFPTYDGKEDPLGWLKRCEHFFRAQRTRDSNKVWLASFHMQGVAQHWFYMLERDSGDIQAISWSLFRTLCQQRFGPPLEPTIYLI